MIYRREIDGLRALAVVPVVLFHAGFELFSGGFVGVDVFFVISGYLITTIILNDLRRGDFSIPKFYERRARRILPALFLVTALSIAGAWYWLLPADMEDLARSASYLPVFLVNLFLYRESGYFDTAAELKPLLHTWSLAVEEQYYVFFPLLLVTLWRRARAFLPHALILAAIASLLWAEYLLGDDPSAAFFLLLPRVWELLAGALVAYWVSCKGALRGSELGAFTGLGLIVVAIALFDEETRFPGITALLPVLGAALVVLYATPETSVGRLLGAKVFVGLGLISYSAYLWHQPLFAFARHASFQEPGPTVFLALSLLSLCLAYLTWRFVEQPFRRNAVVGTRQIVVFSVAGALALSVFAVGGRISEGYGDRMDGKPGLEDITERMRRNYGLHKACDDPGVSSHKCRTTDAPEVLLWGDSYAMHLAEGLLASRPDVGVMQFTQSACGPILELAPVLRERPASWSEECIRKNAQVRDLIRNTASIKYVLLSSKFDQYFAEGVNLLTSNGVVSQDDHRVASALIDTVRELRELGVTPVIFAPTPSPGTDSGRCVTRALMMNEPASACDFALASRTANGHVIEQMLHELTNEVKVVWLSDGLCPQGICATQVDGVIIFRDDGHLSYEGSAYLGRRMNFYDLLVH